MAKVYITRPIADEALALVRGAAQIIAAGENLRAVSNMAVVCDNINVPAATVRNILVCNTPGLLAETTADLAWSLIAAAARPIPEADRHLRAGRWKSRSPQLMLGQDICGSTLGIIGLGCIGQAVARRAKGFDMRILYADLAPKPDAEEALGVRFAELHELLRESDIVSIHTPLTDRTHHLIGARELALMKPSAVLVNTARGTVVDGRALADALREGRIFAAGLDLFESKPPALDDPLLQLDNCVVLPHIGSASVDTRTPMATMAADGLLAALEGRRPPYLVNPEAFSS